MTLSQIICLIAVVPLFALFCIILYAMFMASCMNLARTVRDFKNL